MNTYPGSHGDHIILDSRIAMWELAERAHDLAARGAALGRPGLALSLVCRQRGTPQALVT